MNQQDYMELKLVKKRQKEVMLTAIWALGYTFLLALGLIIMSLADVNPEFIYYFQTISLMTGFGLSIYCVSLSKKVGKVLRENPHIPKKVDWATPLPTEWKWKMIKIIGLAMTVLFLAFSSNYRPNTDYSKRKLEYKTFPISYTDNIPSHLKELNK